MKELSKRRTSQLADLLLNMRQQRGFPWVSPSTMKKLETCQRFAGRVIIGQVKTTLVEAILAEADLPKLATRAIQLSKIAFEKSYRLNPKNPRSAIFNEDVPKRTKKPIWRTQAEMVWGSIFGNTYSLNSQYFTLRGWRQVDASLRQQKASQEMWKQTKMGCATIARVELFDLVLYTDGSAIGGTAKGGGEIILTTGHSRDPQIHRSFAISTGRWCSSF